jgi:hypothetical protein
MKMAMSPLSFRNAKFQMLGHGSGKWTKEAYFRFTIMLLVCRYSFVQGLLTRSVVFPADRKPLFNVPTIKDFFVDLDVVLSVVTDGPAKSFAFRRLKYLSSKWQMYTLLNEYQELADMKVSRSMMCLRYLLTLYA